MLGLRKGVAQTRVASCAIGKWIRYRRSIVRRDQKTDVVGGDVASHELTQFDEEIDIDNGYVSDYPSEVVVFRAQDARRGQKIKQSPQDGGRLNRGIGADVLAIGTGPVCTVFSRSILVLFLYFFFRFPR